jgi:thiol-disulfide isomerase/thioredoxin
MLTIRWFLIATFCLCLSSVQAAMLHEMNGNTISFSALQGKWVFINYWASWCEPCMAEIPELNRFYEDNKNSNVALFAVNYDGLPIAMQKKLIKQAGIQYPSLKQDPANALELGDIRGVPVTFVFNPEGELTKTLYGGQSARSLINITR